MKKLYTLIFIALFGLSLKSGATVITITAANFSFSPATVTAQCNDTIRWNWVSGTHTTTSSTIPNCASSWSGQLNSTSTMYQIMVPCQGTYNYGCSLHVNMTGQILVVCPSGINEQEKKAVVSLYPNPCMDKLIVKYENADQLAVYNVLGEKMMDLQLNGNSGTAELIAAGLTSGVYFVAVMKEGTVVETKKITKQ